MLARRAFSKHFQSWDMKLHCHEYEVDELPRCSGGHSILSWENLNPITTFYMIPRYRFTNRGLYGCYANWLSERFPNLRHLSLPTFEGGLSSYPCDCPANNYFVPFRSSNEIAIAAILESLGAFKNLTSLEWNGCPMLRDEHLEAISETLPKLECLILDGGVDVAYADDTVSNEGIQALAKLTSLRKLHLDIDADTREFDEYTITSAGPASLTALNQLTSLTCRCNMSPGNEAGEDLERISGMVQLRELDLLGAGFNGVMDAELDDGIDAWMMQDACLTPLTSLTNLCKLLLPVSWGWTRKGMENLLQKLPRVSDHNEWFRLGP